MSSKGRSEILFQDVNQDEAIQVSPDLPIFRYVRLPALLMMLRGESFIPTLTKLQETDPRECRVLRRWESFDMHFSSIVKDPSREWLFKKMPEWEKEFISENLRGFSVESHFIDAWLIQLARRRCIWCWYGGSGQSMAQWQIYGNRGVVVRSSLADVREAVSENTPAECTSVGFVRYENDASLRAKTTKEITEWLSRPYYFKDKAYEHEKEVRFTFGVNPDLVDVRGGGISLKIAPAKLIREIMIAPDLFRSEAKSVKWMLQELTKGVGKIPIVISDLLAKDTTSSELVDDWNEQMGKPFEAVDMDISSGEAVELPSELFSPV
jgi:hypothetical protein